MQRTSRWTTTRRSVTVLVADEGNRSNRSALAAVRALAAGGYVPVVTVPGLTTMASSSRWCAGQLRVPPVETTAWVDAVRAEVVSAGHLAVLPASDVAVIALGGPGARLVDKRVVNERAATVGLSVATEMSFSSAAELRASAGELAYPIVVKPAVRTAHGLTSAMRADNRHDLDIVPADAGTLVVQPLLAGNMRAVAGVVVDGRLVAAVHQRYLRIWPRSCGVACAAETVVPDEELERRLLHLLAGYDGIFQIQLVGDHVLDVNPRVYGSLPLAVASGANLPALWCDALAGRTPRGTVRGSAGVPYRWLEGDLRGLASGLATGDLSRRDALRALRPRRGTAHSVESLRDPRPSLTRVAVAMSRRAGRP